MWGDGAAYERFIGRWSRPVAHRFVAWLDAPAGARWVDVGSGTGAVRAAIVEGAAPATVVGLDPSFPSDVQARAEALPLRTGSADVVVSGLVLHFVDDIPAALSEAARVGTTIGAYVWDYSGGMQLLHTFWSVAGALDPRAAELDEARRFPICLEGGLEAAFAEADFGELRSTAIEVPTTFDDFDELWAPFLGAQGPAPTYVATLDDTARTRLRDALHDRLGDGPIELSARAWAAAGTSLR